MSPKPAGWSGEMTYATSRLLTGIVLTDDNDSVAEDGMLLELRLDLAELDAVTIDLDLVIDTTRYSSSPFSSRRARSPLRYSCPDHPKGR